MERYNNQPRFFEALRDLAKAACRHLTTQQLSGQGNHFKHLPPGEAAARVAKLDVLEPRPPHFDEEYLYTHDFDHKPDRDIRHESGMGGASEL